MRHRRAFTLIEVLTVIGVISVLMAIIIPTVRVMREESWSTSCRSTLRQIGTGIQVYRQNIGDRIPICEPLPAVTIDGPEGGLNDLLDGYLDRDCTCWICQADTDPESTDTGTSYLYVPGLLRYLPQIQIRVGQALLPYLENDEWDADQLEQIRRDMESREISALYRQTSGHRLALLVDSQDRHPIGDRLPRNALYDDGSVEQLSESFDDIDYDPGDDP
ncbi:MAG: prepilin-type N-terminal cleavage/methylation domain-containing protein [Phycisphaerales bacterium]|nr:prepilin-type N-terminal cleavage/methylation domain-containing protein [Phycisphaerales bacterium]